VKNKCKTRIIVNLRVSNKGMSLLFSLQNAKTDSIQQNCEYMRHVNDYKFWEQ